MKGANVILQLQTMVVQRKQEKVRKKMGLLPLQTHRIKST